MSDETKRFTMLATVEGVYRNGKVELSEVPKDLPANRDTEIRVIVTFLSPPLVDLPARGIDVAQAAELRARLMTFAEDWNSPVMAIYDEYESHQPDVGSVGLLLYDSPTG